MKIRIARYNAPSEYLRSKGIEIDKFYFHKCGNLCSIYSLEGDMIRGWFLQLIDGYNNYDKITTYLHKIDANDLLARCELLKPFGYIAIIPPTGISHDGLPDTAPEEECGEDTLTFKVSIKSAPST